MNSGRTSAWIGCSHLPEKITDFTTDMRRSLAFGFEFPEKFKTPAIPVDNSIRFYNDERFAPGTPNSGKQNPEEPIHHSNLRSLVRPFHYEQLLAKDKASTSLLRQDRG